jgi:hypothetical protein
MGIKVTERLDVESFQILEGEWKKAFLESEVPDEAVRRFYEAVIIEEIVRRAGIAPTNGEILSGWHYEKCHLRLTPRRLASLAAAKTNLALTIPLAQSTYSGLTFLAG